MTEHVKQMPLAHLRESQDNPRKIFGDLNELAQTIREHGIIQPIIARETGDGTEIVAGHRRFRAARIAGLKEVPVIVRKLSRQVALEEMIIENNKREDVNALEQAEGYAKLMNDFRMNADQVAARVGVSRASVYAATALLELAEPVKKALLAGKVSAATAAEVGRVRGSERLQLKALDDVMKLAKHGEQPPVRAVRRLIQERYLTTAKKGVSKHQREVREHGADVAIRRRVVSRLLARVAELIERRTQLEPLDLRTAALALAHAGDAARDVFNRRQMRPDRLSGVAGAQLRSLVVELALTGFVALEDGEYGAGAKAVAKAYGLSLGELERNVEAESKAEALFAKE